MNTPKDPQITSTVAKITAEKSSGMKVEKKSGKRIGYNYIIVKSLKKSQKNDVVKCFYIKGWKEFGFCVIKEGSYGDSKDKLGRDIIDRLVWQEKIHKNLKGKLRLPGFIGSFEENGNFYLAIQNIKGVSLFEKIRKHKSRIQNPSADGNDPAIPFIDYLIQIASLLEALHNNRYIHRDVTPSNFMITPSSKVYIIDMELTYALDNSLAAPFQLGTEGYMSPEQKLTQPPSAEQDVFSLGAIMLEIFSAVHPIKVIEAPGGEIHNKIKFLIEDQILGDMIARCLDQEPNKRPGLTQIKQILKKYVDDQKKKIHRPVIKDKPYYSKSEVENTIQQVIETFATPLLSDNEKGWFTDKSLFQEEKSSKIEKVWYASFSRGNAGIMYMLDRARQIGFGIDNIAPLFEKGMENIKRRYIDKSERKPGLFDGSDGIAITLASFINSEPPKRTELATWIDLLLTKKSTIPSLSNGWAGQGIANLQCAPYLDRGIVASRLQWYVEQLINTQQKDGAWERLAVAGESRKTKGLLNGVAGIVYFLLEYTNFYDNAQVKSSALKGLEWLVKKSVHTKNGILWQSDSGEGLSYGLQEGAAGIALTFLKAYTVFGDLIYKKRFEQALLQNDAIILDDNFSQLNGLSGLGEVYLEAFSRFNDEKWLLKAERIVQLTMCLRKEHVKHGTYWLTMSEKKPIPDFMMGNAGILHFLIRYLSPFQTPFPLLG